MSQDVATLPAPPTFAGSLGVLAKTDSNITLSLPSIQTEGDGNRCVSQPPFYEISLESQSTKFVQYMKSVKSSYKSSQ